jgi:hypothetical protein
MSNLDVWYCIGGKVKWNFQSCMLSLMICPLHLLLLFLQALYILMLLGYIFLPVYIASGVSIIKKIKLYHTGVQSIFIYWPSVSAASWQEGNAARVLQHTVLLKENFKIVNYTPRNEDVFDHQSVHPCAIICCHQDSAYICWWIYMILWEVVSNSKSMDGIDFQKNLSRGSLFWEGDLVKSVS